MTYIDGIILPLRDEHLDEYKIGADKFARKAKEQGALGTFEGLGDGLEHGKVTDFYKSVQAEDGENVVFSWIEYPDKAVRDAANKAMMEDPRFEALGEMPFDGKRMILSGFAPIFDSEGTLA